MKPGDKKAVKSADKVAEKEEKTEKRILCRSKNDRIVSGVFGGLAEYFSVDPVLFRIIGVVLFFARPGEFILMYIAAAIIIPEAKDSEKPEESRKNENSGRVFIGGALVMLGIIFLLQKYISWFNWDYLWPFIIIGAGVYLLVRK